MNILKKTVLTKERPNGISYTHIEAGASKVCFMFSGVGYKYDHPLFYFATMTMLNNKIDVVQVHYNYDEDLLRKPIYNIAEAMISDIDPVIKDVFHTNKYDQSIFLGKSLGTIPLSTHIIRRKAYLNSKMIVLTPLIKSDEVFTGLHDSSHSHLLVIGDNDPHYLPNKLNELERENMIIEVVKGGDHALNVGEFDVQQSLSSCAVIMEKIDRFVK
ncbi:hypothetical protein [Evansella cellulosilytica]|uniref:Alpha/beta hydrolase n=1 Tax=Evansella cellulosilytica (strain ATCC 21833 / DSM 2522 / FERM P-1141 / JCM 9156 / N-4) TaxID=649639 RepID=E6TVD9_EVAC2|nr:hypothetical protein [Evansella cellulosilytica]ADU30956.1 hypothetical protein Bcell_2701 [Evansella cellulosilytica DSM 2522]